ncbi:hypothetical protein Syun_007006 [Stephania yunnanensis]|uniref:Uncharacterized protein n=1 Tax=Stephania yunnanensis TaxID=152371 RepID=A0AAP0L0A4_9MAGN
MALVSHHMPMFRCPFGEIDIIRDLLKSSWYLVLKKELKRISRQLYRTYIGMCQ